MGTKTNRPSVVIKTYEKAASIVREYSENEQYLRSLIRNCVVKGSLVVDCSDFQNLKYHGRTILGVAHKMLRGHSIAGNILNLKNTKNRDARGVLEERICMQLEGCKVEPENWLSNFYIWARKIYPN